MKITKQYKAAPKDDDNKMRIKEVLFLIMKDVIERIKKFIKTFTINKMSR